MNRSVEEPIFLYPNRLTKVLRLLFMWAMVAVFWKWSSPVLMPLIYLFTAFMGLASIIELVNIVPGSSYLKLTHGGFTRKVLFVTAPEMSWGNYEKFGAVPAFQGSAFSSLPGLGFYKTIMWSYSDSYKAAIRSRIAGTPAESRWEKVAARNRARTGFEAGMAETYGMKAEKLAELMNRFREGYSSP